MKKITLLILLISSIGFSQTTLLDFESSTTWTNFDGGVMTTEANPHNNSDNSSANVGKMVKNADKTWGGSWTQLSSAIDFANNNTLTMKVYSPRVGATVLLKVENATTGSINFEKTATTTVANGWETLTFDYSAINNSNSYEKVVIIFDNGTVGDGTANFTFYVDDLVLSNTTSGSTISLPLDFETATTWGDFDGGAVTTITNPQNNSDNSSANVGQMVKNADKTWGGSSLILTSAMDFANNDTFKMKVYSSRSDAKVLLKVENSGTPSINFEKEVTMSSANTWETLTFDYSSINASNNYDKIVVIFDNGTMGDGSANFTFYFDDIALSNSGTPALAQIDLPVDFEGSTTNYTVTDFGGNSSSLVANPDDASDMVIKSIKTVSAQTWAGTTIGTSSGFATVIPFTASARKMSARVWSPDAGIPVMIKVEESGDDTKSVETLATTTVANGWQILEFDFDNQRTATAAFNASYNYNKASIFFNFDTNGSGGEKTYYFDDVVFGDASVLNSDSFNLSNVSLFPNPVSNQLTINANVNIENVQIYNILGKQVLTKSLNERSASIDVSSLNSGIYILKYISYNNKFGVQKFIKK